MIDDPLEPRNVGLEERRFEADMELRRAENKVRETEHEAQRTQSQFERRYKLLELKERRQDREQKRQELDATQGRRFRVTTGQAALAAAAAAVIGAVGAVFGALITSGVTRDVEFEKNKALISIEQLKARANIELEQQKQGAAERLDRAKFETTLILKATEAPKREDQIRNLKFFLNAGFIRDPEGKIAKMDDSAYPSVPLPASPGVSGTCPRASLVSALSSDVRVQDTPLHIESCAERQGQTFIYSYKLENKSADKILEVRWDAASLRGWVPPLQEVIANIVSLKGPTILETEISVTTTSGTSGNAKVNTVIPMK